MADETAADGIDGLQFDRVVPASPDQSDRTGAVCTACQAPIDNEYYDVNGRVACARCRAALEAWAETPAGVGPLARAGLFGLGAAIAGALIYYAVLAVAHLQVGIIAILTGYIVGRAVRIGARNRGGLRFQVLAAALTYISVALAYTPIVVGEVARSAQTQQSPPLAADRTSSASPTGVDTRPAALPRTQGFGRGAAVLLALFLALPVLFVVGSLPSGLISALIIGIGMRQAWRMTAAPWIQVLGPYRVGTPEAATSA
jgi:hypothetical protein